MADPFFFESSSISRYLSAAVTGVVPIRPAMGVIIADVMTSGRVVPSVIGHVIARKGASVPPLTIHLIGIALVGRIFGNRVRIGNTVVGQIP